MKMRYLLMVSLILTIITLGAVSASENITDEGLAADIEIEDSISEIGDSLQDEVLVESADDVLGDYHQDGIDVEIASNAVIDNPDDVFNVIHVFIYNEKWVGKTFKVFVNDSLAYNFTIDSIYSSDNINSSKLGIQGFGDYKIDFWAEETFLTSGSIFVSNYTFNVDVSDLDDNGYIEYQDILEYRVNLPSDANGTVTIVVNGKSYTVNLDEGAGRLFISTDGMNLGDNTVVVTYNGDGKYNNMSRRIIVSIVPKLSYPSIFMLSSTSMVMSVGEKQYITFVAPKTANGMVEVALRSQNGTTYKNVTISNGQGRYLLSNLAQGSYYLMINGKIGNIDVNRYISLSVINNPSSYAVSVSPTQIVEGGLVNLNIKSPTVVIMFVIVDNALSKFVYITGESVNDVISGLAVGTHNIKLIGYEMNGGISYSKSFNVVVKAKPIAKKATKITAAKKTYKVKTKTKKYTVTLKAGTAVVKNVKLTLKVKGKTYKATTNTKGKATFKITKLAKKGAFKAVIKFAGNNNYKASSKTVKITVK